MDDNNIDLEELDLLSFFNLDFNDSNDAEIIECSIISQNIVQSKVQEINEIQLKNTFSYEGTCDVVKLINNMPGAIIKLPDSKKRIQHMLSEMTIVKPIYLVFCKTCDQIVENGENCSKCMVMAKKVSKKNNFLVHFPIIPQICRILKLNLDDIMKYLHRNRNENISDVDDGLLHRKLRAKYGDNLITFTLNTDGANVHKSSKFSLWPVQLYVNCLPPSIRFLSENIIVTTLYYGKFKPDMNTLLFPLAKELEEIDKEPISIYTSDNEIIVFKTIVPMIASDLPARASIQNFVGHTGKYGCPYCYHPGIPIKNASGKNSTIRYINKENVKLRTHEETIELIRRTSNECDKTTKSIEGVKGPSAAFMFSEIDLIKSFSIDYMHGVGLGVMKHMIEIWIGKKAISPKPPYPDYKIKKTDHRKILDSRIIRLKPPQYIRRLPRGLDEVSNFKASELIHHMWFYLRYTLTGLLPIKVIKNFEKLSSASYILCKEQINSEEIKMACDMLTEFATEFEDIYGQGAITLNIHLLKHYHEMVLNCGPLWSHSLFGFENNIGVLKNFVSGNTDVLEQISKKYAAVRINECVGNNCSNDFKISRETEVKFETRYVPIFKQFGINKQEGDSFKVFQRFEIGNNIYTSTCYVETRNCDYFVRMNDNRIGKIIFYFYCSVKRPSLLLEMYEECEKNHHWIEIKSTEQLQIYRCEDLKTKIMYFQGFQTEYVTSMPNRYSRSCF